MLEAVGSLLRAKAFAFALDGAAEAAPFQKATDKLLP
jgi:hypothetical protein